MILSIIVKAGKGTLSFDGNIWKIFNRFYVDIEVPLHMTLNNVITDIRGYFSPFGNVSLKNNRCISIVGSISKLSMSTYTYEADYIITGHENIIKIRSMILYFKELDKFFVKDKHIFNIKNGWTIFCYSKI